MQPTLPPLFLTSQIREIERRHGSDGLMENAGLAAADLARKLIGTGKRVLVLAGPGNNGGDGLVAARWLKDRGFEVTVVFTGEASRLPQDAATAHAQWAAAGGTTLAELPQGEFDLVIDALFGIGLTRAPEGVYPELIEYINAQPALVLALDISTGLDADTGRAHGICVEADHTLTFIGLKPGLFTLEGPDHAGEVHLADLGLPAANEPSGFLINRPPCLPPPRRKNSHKGSYGDVAVIGGAETMVGAAFMAARAALFMGSGRVFAGLLARHAPIIDLRQPELMVREAASVVSLDPLDVLIVGPGLGRSSAAHDLSALALKHAATLVLDADALNLIAAASELQTLLKQRRSGSTVITPHPGEAATLLQTDTVAVQADRVAAACQLATRFNAVAVLKGCGSLVATPDGRWFVNASGNPGMAAAGMGDVLAGVIGGLIAQKLDAESATLLGVHLHGAAGDALVGNGIGPVGLTASEIAQEARSLLNLWVKNNG